MKLALRCCFSLVILILFIDQTASAQIAWYENFTANPCDSLCPAAGYVSSNGTWTITSSTAGAKANQWFVSQAENAPNSAGGCAGLTGTGQNTLHIGNVGGSPDGVALSCPTGDCGAEYDNGNSSGSVVTDTRIETPVINLTTDTGLTLSFLYFEGGDGTNDNFTIDYFDGTAWSQLADPDKTAPICPPVNNHPGLWTAYAIKLPSSANKNPDVKIGFHWVNNDDGVGGPSSVAISAIVIAGKTFLPIASFSGGDTSFCSGTCVTYTNTGAGGISYSWTFTGGSSGASSLKYPSAICYSTAGTYTTRLIATNTSGSDTATKTIIVKNCTAPSITTGAVSGSSCMCATFQLSYTITGMFNSGNVFTAQLSNSSGNFISPANIGTLTGTSSGSISVVIPCDSVAGAGYKIRIISSTPSITGSNSGITIIEVPTSSFTVSPDTVCGNSATATITFTGTASANASYNWGFSGGTVASGSGKGPYIVIWSTLGTKTITLTVTDGDCTSSGNTKSVLINTAPYANFVVDADSICVGVKSILTFTGQESGTFTWNFDGGTGNPGTGQGPQTVTWPAAGTYNPSLTVKEDGCTSNPVSQKVVVSMCTGIDNVSANASLLQVYPNPANDKLMVTASALVRSTITISDVLGKTLFTHIPTTNGVTIDVSSLSPGVYFLSVKYGNGGSEVRKFVKE